MNDCPDQATIGDAARLREHFGDPVDLAVAIIKTELDAHHRRFIEHSPFMCLAAAGADGQPSVSPKGDAPGFVKVLDARTLVIPDRPGNNKVETFHHLLDNPKVAMVFFIPGVQETLRLHGEARLSTEPALLELGRVGNRLPPAALRVTVTRAYFHCGKALIRSRLWDPDRRVAPGTIPPFGQVLKEQAAAPASVEAIQQRVDDVYVNKLY